MHRVTVFGEVLFDCFPGGEEVLGGAPFNVAWHLQAFGEQPCFVSRVGEDATGSAVRRAMADWGMDTAYLQTDRAHATGRVQVTLQGSEPSYDIVDGAAYDFIDAQVLGDVSSRILYHGSLGLRNPTSLQALERLRQANHPTVFMDVNLRDPWWQREQVLQWVDQADWVKLNEEELALLQGREGDLAARADAFLRQHGLQGLVVTRGEEGATLLMRDQAAIDVAPVAALQVVDTVGAGDALASVLLLGISRAWPMAETLERAQRFASAVVGQRGATTAQRAFYGPFFDAWGLARDASN